MRSVTHKSSVKFFVSDRFRPIDGRLGFDTKSLVILVPCDIRI